MNRILMYSKQTCPYCIRAEQLLLRKGIAHIAKIDIEAHPDEMEKLMARTGRRTVPQIYIGDTHVGGYDDLAALDRAGGLEPLLNRNNPSLPQSPLLQGGENKVANEFSGLNA